MSPHFQSFGIKTTIFNPKAKEPKINKAGGKISEPIDLPMCLHFSDNLLIYSPIVSTTTTTTTVIVPTKLL